MKLYDHLLGDKKKSKRERDFDILRKIRVTLPSQLPENQAASLLGPVLGQYGINISLFSKQFLEKSKNFDPEIMLNIIITLYKNKSFFLEIKRPSIGFLLYEMYNHQNLVEKNPDFNFLALDSQLQYIHPSTISFKQYLQLIKFITLTDTFLNAKKIEGNLRGTLKSMNIQIKENC